MMLLDSQSGADTVHDPTLGFTLNLPSDFAARPDLVGAAPGLVHAFQYGEVTEDEMAVLLLVERMGGVIGRDRITPQHLPTDFNGELFVTTWQGFQLDGIKVIETVNGINAITLNVQIPLKREAIQIKIFGPAHREETIKRLLDDILNGLNGQSNWLSSVAPAALAGSESYGTILLCVTIVGGLTGLGILWWVSRRTPRGTVLAIAVLLYCLSYQNADTRVREHLVLSGATRLFAVAAGILGIVDLGRKRGRKTHTQQATEASAV